MVRTSGAARGASRGHARGIAAAHAAESISFGSGSDPVQSLGRQCAALDLLERRFFRSHAVMTKQVSSHPATVAKRADYGAGFARLREQYVAAVGGMDDAKQRT
jgi:hypothetical protein